MPTRDEAIQRAARDLAVSNAAIDAMTPREQAEAAWTPTSRFNTIDALENHIRQQRGYPPLPRARSA